MSGRMKWYNQLNFYELVLINDKTVYWWTELSLNEVKEKIAKEGFVFVSSGRADYYEEEDINTKVIRSIKDVTIKERKRKREWEEYITTKMRLIRAIRKSMQPPAVQRLIRKMEKRYRKEIEQNQWDWYDRDCGMHLDVLMHYNEDYLKKILEKCQKRDLIS